MVQCFASASGRRPSAPDTIVHEYFNENQLFSLRFLVPKPPIKAFDAYELKWHDQRHSGSSAITAGAALPVGLPSNSAGLT
jgi:hypothetical protein